MLLKKSECGKNQLNNIQNHIMFYFHFKKAIVKNVCKFFFLPRITLHASFNRSFKLTL